MGIGQQGTISNNEGATHRCRGNRHPVVVERAVSRQAGDLESAGCLAFGVADRNRTALPANRRQDTVVVQADATFPLDDLDRSTNHWRLIDRIEADIDRLVGNQAASPVIDGDLEGVADTGRGHLVPVMAITQVGNVGHRKRRADRNGIASEQQTPLARHGGNLDDGLGGTVVDIAQAKLALGKANRKDTGRRKRRSTAFADHQRRTAAHAGRIIDGRYHQIADHARRGAIAVGDIADRDRDRGCIAGQRAVLVGSRRKNHAVDGRIDGRHTAGDRHRSRVVCPGADCPAATSQGHRPA